jgi:hypothetical protein
MCWRTGITGLTITVDPSIAAYLPVAFPSLSCLVLTIEAPSIISPSHPLSNTGDDVDAMVNSLNLFHPASSSSVSSPTKPPLQQQPLLKDIHLRLYLNRTATKVIHLKQMTALSRLILPITRLIIRDINIDDNIDLWLTPLLSLRSLKRLVLKSYHQISGAAPRIDISHCGITHQWPHLSSIEHGRRYHFISLIGDPLSLAKAVRSFASCLPASTSDLESSPDSGHLSFRLHGFNHEYFEEWLQHMHSFITSCSLHDKTPTTASTTSSVATIVTDSIASTLTSMAATATRESLGSGSDSGSGGVRGGRWVTGISVTLVMYDGYGGMWARQVPLVQRLLSDRYPFIHVHLEPSSSEREDF